MSTDTRELSFPEELGYLGETHEYTRLEGNIATFGISDYAQHEIGDVVYVEMPEVGTTVQAGKPFGVIESVKSAFDLVAGMSGEVIEVNSELEEHPERVNEDPYGEGWMVKIRVSDPDEFGQLLDADAYQETIENH